MYVPFIYLGQYIIFPCFLNQIYAEKPVFVCEDIYMTL